VAPSEPKTSSVEDVMETEVRLVGIGEPLPMVARRLDQDEGAGEIGLDESGRPVDRAVDMAFGGEVHHHLRPELLDDRARCRCIANVGLCKTIARFFRHAGEIVEVPRIGELVEDADFVPGVLNKVAHHRGADEPGTASNKKSLGRHRALTTRMGKRTS
jgi:hypothetical protein